MGMAVDTGPSKGAKPVINVTPLVDVVLVLLIIFMVIIPNMQDGKPVEIIQVMHPDKKKDDSEPLKVTITVDEEYVVGDSEVSRDEALAQLTTVYEGDPKHRILLRGDARLPYHIVRSFFSDVQEIGFEGVALAVGKQREWTDMGGH